MATATKPATTVPFKDRQPPNAPRCIVHGARMQFAPDLAEKGGLRCTFKGDNGEQCTFQAYPRAVPPEKIRNSSYVGGVRVWMQQTMLPDGTPEISVYLQLIELALLVDITKYIDMDRGGMIVPETPDKPLGLSLAFHNYDLS